MKNLKIKNCLLELFLSLFLRIILLSFIATAGVAVFSEKYSSSAIVVLAVLIMLFLSVAPFLFIGHKPVDHNNCSHS